MASKATSKDGTIPATEYIPYEYHLPKEAEWGGFININLDEQQKKDFKAWFGAFPDAAAVFLEELLNAGIKVTLAIDTDNRAHLCSFTGGLVFDSTERFVCTSRGSSMWESVALMCFKHVFIQQGSYQKYSNNNKPLWG